MFARNVMIHHKKQSHFGWISTVRCRGWFKTLRHRELEQENEVGVAESGSVGKCGL